MSVPTCSASPPSKAVWRPTDTTRLHRRTMGLGGYEAMGACRGLGVACWSRLGGLPDLAASRAHPRHPNADSNKWDSGRDVLWDRLSVDGRCLRPEPAAALPYPVRLPRVSGVEMSLAAHNESCVARQTHALVWKSQQARAMPDRGACSSSSTRGRSAARPNSPIPTKANASPAAPYAQPRQ